MTKIHVQKIGESALLPDQEFERLLELARLSEQIALEVQEEEMPTAGLMQLAEASGAFDFWREPGEDLYSVEDGEPV